MGRHQGPLLALIVMAVSAVMVAQPRAQAPAQSPRDVQLTAAVNDFLDRWLRQREPETAVDKYMSPLVNDERLLPAEAFTLSEYQSKFGGDAKLRAHPIDFGTARKLMGAYLRSQLRDAPALPVTQRFLPWTDEAVSRAGLARQARVFQARPSNSLTLTYSVTSWADVEWTNSGAIGWQLLMPDLIARNRLDARAVVLRLATPGVTLPRDPLLFMLWVTPEAGPPNWQFFGLELPPAN
jgi:hypothetical protein